MKHVYSILSGKGILTSLLVLSVGFCSCGSVSDASPSAARGHDANLIVPTGDDNSPMSWENLFRRVPGVQVRGRYPDLSFLIRGAKSVSRTTEPLFVLEGVPLGHNFGSLARATTPNEVANIRILKGTQASLYGARGANGVILVKLKQ